jgi:hypothetical protein
VKKLGCPTFYSGISTKVYPTPLVAFYSGIRIYTQENGSDLKDRNAAIVIQFIPAFCPRRGERLPVQKARKYHHRGKAHDTENGKEGVYEFEDLSTGHRVHECLQKKHNLSGEGVERIEKFFITAFNSLFRHSTNTCKQMPQ